MSAPAEGNAGAPGRASLIGNATVDFGTYGAHEKKVARYTIGNDGPGVLRILKVRKTCGCASAAAERNEVAPGGETIVEVVILPHSIFGQYSKNTFVETDDPENRFVKLTVAGNSIPLVRILPEALIHVGRLKTGLAWSRTFTLEPTEPGVELGKPEVECTFPVDVSLVETNVGYRLALDFPPADAGGDLRCSVLVPVVTPSNHPPIKVGVTAKMGAQLTAVPGLARLPLSDQSQSRSFRLHVLGQRSRQLTPDELLLPKKEGVDFHVRQDPNGLWLVVEATFHAEFMKQLMAESSIPLTFAVPQAASTDVICRAPTAQSSEAEPPGTR